MASIDLDNDEELAPGETLQIRPDQKITKITVATDFLTKLFGDYANDENQIYISERINAADQQEADAGKQTRRPIKLSHPCELDGYNWAAHSHKHSYEFCTGLIKSDAKTNRADAILTVPAAWTDIDLCKQLPFLDADEFFRDLQETEDASFFLRSSKKGIQALFKLTNPVYANGNPKIIEEKLQPLLYAIALYFGGDFRATNSQMLMRLPGSVNNKPEYKDKYVVPFYAYDKSWSIDDLKKRFAVTENTLPKIIRYGLTSVLAPIMVEGSRHEAFVQLAGTMKVCGLDSAAAEVGVRDLGNYFRPKDVEDCIVALRSTYEKGEDEKVKTLKEEYEEIHNNVKSLIYQWLELKTLYCKKMGIAYERKMNPLISDSGAKGIFFESNGQTFANTPKGQSLFANFVMSVRQTVIKKNHVPAWVCEIAVGTDHAIKLEISGDDLTTDKQFQKSAPTGAVCLIPALWSEYIAFKKATAPTDRVIESTFFGVLLPDKDEPIMLLPNEKHPLYEYRGEGETTLDPRVLTLEPDEDEIRTYLTKFRDFYATYHEPEYLYTALGWFAAVPMSMFVREIHSGFPTLCTYALSGAGKSELISRVLSNNFGSKTSLMFSGATKYAINMHLVSNNVSPLLVDEFRNANRVKVNQLEEVVRSLWDKSEVTFGRASNTLFKEQIQAPMAIIGEHAYEDDAAMQRTVFIAMQRTYTESLDTLQKHDPDQWTELARRKTWLQSPLQKGMMGYILLDFIRKNWQVARDSVRRGVTAMEKACLDKPVSIDRKRAGIATVFAGISLLSRVYEAYGLKFGISSADMTTYIFGADPKLLEVKGTDASAFDNLFAATDDLILDSIRAHRPLVSHLYEFDPEDGDIVYFEMRRWQRTIRPYLRDSSTASLHSTESFIAMLQGNAVKDPDLSAILGFPTDVGPFNNSCVKLSMKRISSLYKVNVDSWRRVGSNEE